MKILLWLDDVRDPFKDKTWLVFSPIEEPYHVVWLKSYKEFTHYITQQGIPDAICFDHDLAFDHYQTFAVEASDYERMSLEQSFGTGMDCATWLVSYCMDNNVELPKWNIQSANPIGKENIKMLLENYSNR